MLVKMLEMLCFVLESGKVDVEMLLLVGKV